MSEPLQLKLPSGKIIFADATSAPPDENWGELAAKKSNIFDAAEVFDSLRETLAVAAEKLCEIGPRTPDKVTLEMNVEIASGGVIKILAGEAKGGLKVALSWDNKDTSKNK